MHFRKNYDCLLGVIGICLFVSSVPSRSGIESRADVMKRWRDLGRQVLYESVADRGLSATWLDQELDAVDPNSRETLRTAEVILTNALDDFGRDAIVVEGRIPLEVNPQCILGLYSSERFPGTRLGDWGRRRFRQCVEQAYLAATPSANSAWRAQLEAEMLVVKEVFDSSFQRGALAWVEVPYVYLYLIDMAQSTDTRYKARECLARYLWQEYGRGCVGDTRSTTVESIRESIA